MTEQEKRWIEAWRIAGPELERIRDEELRSLDDANAIGLLGGSRRNNQETNGLAVFQAWMMRLKVIELLKSVAQKT